MPLAYEVTQVPEGLESFYKQVDDGKFVLDVEDLVPASKLQETENALKGKVDEFRNNNIALKAQLEQLTGQKPTDSDISKQVDALFNERVAPLKQNLDALSKEKQQLRTQLERVVISDSVKEAAIKYGVQESAIQDVLNRVSGQFAVVEGKAVAKDGKLDGEGNPLSIETSIRDLAQAAPHLFMPSTGSGAFRPERHVPGRVQPKTASEKLAAGLASKIKR